MSITVKVDPIDRDISLMLADELGPEGRQWAADLVMMFIGKDLGGVIIRDVDGPVTDDRNEDGNYYRLAVAAAYEFDFTA